MKFIRTFKILKLQLSNVQTFKNVKFSYFKISAQICLGCKNWLRSQTSIPLLPRQVTIHQIIIAVIIVSKHNSVNRPKTTSFPNTIRYGQTDLYILRKVVKQRSKILFILKNRKTTTNFYAIAAITKVVKWRRHLTLNDPSILPSQSKNNI